MVNTSTPTNSLENFFMPFTANKDFKKEPRLLEKGEGVYYYNHKGDKVIDCSSGLFCVPLGHGRKEIADAVHQQLLKLDYAPSFAISHMPAFTLAERLAKMLPGDLNNIFFTICGSTAIDSAIKIIQAYQHAKGQSQRIRFVSRERAYHGVNIGGTSLSGMIKK
jgi:beta-alanine--pyruvate transaminase